MLERIWALITELFEHTSRLQLIPPDLHPRQKIQEENPNVVLIIRALLTFYFLG